MGIKRHEMAGSTDKKIMQFTQYHIDVINDMMSLFSEDAKYSFDSFLWHNNVKLDEGEKQKISPILGDKMDPIRNSFWNLKQASEEAAQQLNADGNSINAMNTLMAGYRSFSNAVHQWTSSLSSKELSAAKDVFSKFASNGTLSNNGNPTLSDFLFKNSLLGERRIVKDTDFNPGSRNRMTKMKPDEKIFPQGDPKPEEVLQGLNGSCYMLSSLRSLAAKNPQFIKDMIQDNNDGTVTVHFNDRFGNIITPLEVTIEKSLPPTDRQSPPWVRLIEKAYVVSGLKMENKGKMPIPGYDMGNLGWGDPGRFLNDITPVFRPRNLPTDGAEDLTTFQEVREHVGNKLMQASDDGAALVISTPKHAMAVTSIKKDEKTGKTMINYFDQYKKKAHTVSMEDFFSPKSQFSSIDIHYPNGPRKNEVDTFFSKDRAIEYARKLDYISKKDFTKQFTNMFMKPVKEIAENSNDPALKSKDKEIQALFEKNPAVKKIINEAYSRVEKRNTYGDIEKMNTPNNPFRKEIMDKLGKAFVQDLTKNTKDPISQSLIIAMKNAATVQKQAAPNAPVQEAAQKAQEAKADPNVEKMQQLYESLQTTRAKNSKNSPEFNAMADAVGDLCEAYKNPKSFSKETVKLLEERAYAKCNFYQRNKNPYTADGKLRKNAALDMMHSLERKNPEVRSNLYHTSNKAMEIELACQLAGQLTEQSAGAFSSSNKDIIRSTNLATVLGNGPHGQGQYLQKLAADLPMRTGWDTYEKMCQKGPMEAVQKMMSQRAEAIKSGKTLDPLINSLRRKENAPENVKKQLGVTNKNASVL